MNWRRFSDVSRDSSVAGDGLPSTKPIHGNDDPVAAEAARGISDIEAFLADVSTDEALAAPAEAAFALA